MSMKIHSQDYPAEAVPGSRLFKEWVAGDLDADFLAPALRDAGRELERALTIAAVSADERGEVAPLFRSEWVSGWAREMAGDLPTDEDRGLFREQVAALRTGAAEVVIAGQQPGFLGGPLYTLYKIATVVALARKRTLAGRPTVPVFWSGDDDDDLAEALAPVAWNPATGISSRGSDVRPVPTAPGRSRMLGRLAGDPWSREAARWLNQAASLPGGKSNPLGEDLAEIWRVGTGERWTWSRLARRSLLRVFTGSGLMVVSGDDPGLHRAAGPLYEKILAGAGDLAARAARRGAELSAGGWHAQINARSLARSLFLVESDTRVVCAPGIEISDTSVLRPGVMLRSPVQDWLLRPAAVVIGPGELAYLRQLDTVYEGLGVTRPPLVPRLFAWLLPPGFDTDLLRVFRTAGNPDSARAERLATGAAEEAGRVLSDILVRELDVEERRAVSLAEGRARRWRKGVSAMLRDEMRRTAREGVPSGPEWVFPDGGRQERHLACLCAAALWGDDLVETCLEAADRHIECGAARNWREFALKVPDPAR